MNEFDRWRAAIQAAQDTRTVENVLTEFVRALPPDQVADLPLNYCQAIAAPIADVYGSAIDLLQTELRYDGDERIAELMHEISLTFTAASMRLAQLDASRRHPQDVALFKAYHDARSRTLPTRG